MLMIIWELVVTLVYVHASETTLQLLRHSVGRTLGNHTLNSFCNISCNPLIEKYYTHIHDARLLSGAYSGQDIISNMNKICEDAAEIHNFIGQPCNFTAAAESRKNNHSDKIFSTLTKWDH